MAEETHKNEKVGGKSFRWVDAPDKVGEFLFTFDGEKIFNLFADYPEKLDPEEKRLFDAENPRWADFFKGRMKE